MEYGQVSFRNRTLGMEHWVDEVLPAAIREVSAHAGGRPVHVVGWSLGGIFAMLTAADQPGPADRLADRRSAPRSTSRRCRWSRRCARCSTSPTGAGC